jgi:hypothetical protein
MVLSFKRKLNPRWAPTLYFVLGQAGWFACVLSAARGASYWGIALVAVLVGLHLLRAERPWAEVKLLTTVVVMGGVWESALLFFGLLAYPHSTVEYGVAPLWLMALWGLFAAQLNTTYRWLKHRVMISVLLGAFAGPLSFRAGAALGALRFVKVMPATVSLAMGWAILLPTVILLSRRWDGVDSASA